MLKATVAWRNLSHGRRRVSHLFRPRGGAAHLAVSLSRFIGRGALLLRARVTAGCFVSNLRFCMEYSASCVRSQRPVGRSVCFLYLPSHTPSELQYLSILTLCTAVSCVLTIFQWLSFIFCDVTTYRGSMSRDVIGATSLAVRANMSMMAPQVLR